MAFVYEPGGDLRRGGRADLRLPGTLVSFGLGKVVSFDSSGPFSGVERRNMACDSGSKMGRVLAAPGRLVRNGQRRWTGVSDGMRRDCGGVSSVFDGHVFGVMCDIFGPGRVALAWVRPRWPRFIGRVGRILAGAFHGAGCKSQLQIGKGGHVVRRWLCR